MNESQTVSTHTDPLMTTIRVLATRLEVLENRLSESYAYRSETEKTLAAELQKLDKIRDRLTSAIGSALTGMTLAQVVDLAERELIKTRDEQAPANELLDKMTDAKRREYFKGLYGRLRDTVRSDTCCLTMDDFMVIEGMINANVQGGVESFDQV